MNEFNAQLFTEEEVFANIYFGLYMINLRWNLYTLGGPLNIAFS